MPATKTRLSFGDLQKLLGEEFHAQRRPLSRSILDRLLRDWAREIPEPEMIAGCRTWALDDLDMFRSIVRRDREGHR